MKKDQNGLDKKLEDKREQINSVLDIDPEILKEIHGGMARACSDDCCKWEPQFA